MKPVTELMRLNEVLGGSLILVNEKGWGIDPTPVDSIWAVRDRRQGRRNKERLIEYLKKKAER